MCLRTIKWNRVVTAYEFEGGPHENRLNEQNETLLEYQELILFSGRGQAHLELSFLF